MKRDELRRQLKAFHQDGSAAEYDSWGQPHLVPPPRLDAEYADLFRAEAAEGVKAAFAGDPWRLSRWSSFIQAGCNRRRQAMERRHLAERLAEASSGETMALPGSLVDALVKIAGESSISAGHPPPVLPPADGILARESLLAGWSPAGESAAGLSRQVFAAQGQVDLWRLLTGSAGFLRRGDGQVTLTRGRETGTLARILPGQVWLLHRPQAGMTAWELFIKAAGEALALAHLPDSLPPEDMWLPGDGGAAIYGCLWARRLLQPTWYSVTGVAGERAEALSRLARGRLAARLLELATATREGRPVLSAAAGREWLSAWPLEAILAMDRLCPMPGAAECLHQEHMAALLDQYLLRRFGYDWDRSPRAADLLRQLWSEGWARPVHELLSFLGETDPEGEALLEDFD